MMLNSCTLQVLSHAASFPAVVTLEPEKQRSAEQALLLLQEQIYTAWRGRRVVSLISFDVKGAYNGVYKGRLLQSMKARGIPESLILWVEAFCSE
jgi:hypothetical protein